MQYFTDKPGIQHFLYNDLSTVCSVQAAIKEEAHRLVSTYTVWND